MALREMSEPYILLLEGEDFITAKNRVWQDTIRNLDAIMLLPGASQNIKGLLIGKYPQTYKLNLAELRATIDKRDYLQNIPIIYNFPRGYAQPSLVLPIGEELIIEALDDNTINLSIV